MNDSIVEKKKLLNTVYQNVVFKLADIKMSLKFEQGYITIEKKSLTTATCVM